jgi:protein-tyrosine kinase
MSVVERALKKIQSAASAGRHPEEKPVAHAVANSAAAGVRRGSHEAFGGIASSRAVSFDFEALAEAGLLAPGNDLLADEYRVIKQPILRKAGDRSSEDAERNSLVMVASSLPGEGKTFTCVNLSLSLSQERDWSVLLVDADSRNPSLSRLLGVADQPGLLDLLKSPSGDLASYVLSTNIERLFILPLGQADPNAAELLASAGMDSVCRRLSSGEFGKLIVVFDSSPLLLTPEPVIVSAHVGQILVVVQANRSVRPAVKEACGLLDRSKTIGLVFNRAGASDGHRSYGYRYGTYGQRETAG